MNAIQRLRRLWAMSDMQPASSGDAFQIKAQLAILDAKADKLSEWMGVLLRAELQRHEEQQNPVPARRSLR